ncbi:MAG: alpha/beta hydrolase [Spirochaetes bacterium]|nr:alpha/beta hydrolase [Spirochaetota bacterium]MBU1079263.1 alpha/beta hydrolase [Spirochaetota bacterium]
MTARTRAPRAIETVLRRASSIPPASVAILVFLASYSCALLPRTPPIEGPAPVASLERVTLGGVEQTMLVRGADTSKPILLFVHGGPGMVGVPLEHAMRYLEDDFIVVTYDQRGAGKSGSIEDGAAPIGRYVDDLVELERLLVARFGKERVYLVGHSWGSLVAMLAVKQEPALVAAYIGVGHVVSTIEQEALSYRFAVDRARETRNSRALAELSSVAPPYLGEDGRLRMEDLALQRKWLELLGGVWYDYRKMGNKDMLGVYFSAREYSIVDWMEVERRAKYATVATWNESMAIDLRVDAARIEAPAYFFTGRRDYNTPHELISDYYRSLDAPAGKDFVWFERSGHVPFMEEPERFHAELLRVVAETEAARTRPY